MLTLFTTTHKWALLISVVLLVGLANFFWFLSPSGTIHFLPKAGFLSKTEAQGLKSDSCDHSVGLEIEQVDGKGDFADVQPGDTVCIEAGTRSVLKIEHIHGEQGNPITFINKGGVVVIEATDEVYAGIHFQDSEYVRLTGSGISHRCGSPFAIEDQACGFVVRGSQRGVVGSEKTRYIEIDHVESDSPIKMGFFVRTSGTAKVDRENWTQYGTYLHHNYVHYAGTEGFYVGGSKYADGLDPVLIGVEVSYNLIMYTGWDGLQVGSAVADCTIHHNRILNDSLENQDSQRSGIMNNRGSVCHIFGNFIADSTGQGIYVQGNGGNEIYNNVIVRPGKGSASAGDGIVVSQGSNTGQSVYIWNNTIVEPARDGIRFRNEQGDDNQIQNNLIVMTGTLFPDTEAIRIADLDKVTVANNLFFGSVAEARFTNPEEDDFSLLPDSPAVDAGVDLGVSADYRATPRPQGSATDIGAFEYMPSFEYTLLGRDYD